MSTAQAPCVLGVTAGLGSDCVTYTEMTLDKLRRKADRTSDVTDAGVSDVTTVAPTLVRVQRSVIPTTSPSNEGCAHTPGKKPAVFLLSRILRASRRSGAWVYTDRLP